jgi:hypothetical protein
VNTHKSALQNPAEQRPRMTPSDKGQDSGKASFPRGELHVPLQGQTPSSLLAFQRTVGNRALTDALGRRQAVSPTATAHDGAAHLQRQSDDLSSSGPPLSSGSIPASFMGPQGLPAARYNLPNVLIATATVVTPNAIIQLELLLRGNIQATSHGSLPGVSMDQSGFRVQADSIVDGLNRGLRINGIGGDEVSIGTTWGTDLETNEVRFTPPNRFAYIGQAVVALSRLTPAGIIGVRGQVGFELRATVIPKPSMKPRASEPTWWERNWGYVAGAGLIVGAGLLVVGTVVEDVATGGAGIVDDPASFAAAGALASAGASAF